MEELRDEYVKKLGKALDMEQCIVENLPGIIEAASNDRLREGLADHLKETRGHITRVEQVLAGHKSGELAVEDKAFRLMIAEAEKEIASIEDPNVRDAVIIAAAQSVEHIEMARYGTLVEWAKQLDENGDSINILKATLNEEEEADKKLTSVAEGGVFTTGVNEMAAK